MRDEIVKEENLVRYLLGQMSEEEQERIEEGYLGDREFFERLLAVEDELIDAYVRDRLSHAERERFENHFMRTPARRERVEFAREWMSFVSSPMKKREVVPAKLPSLRESVRMKNIVVWLPLAAAVALAIGGAWLFMQTAQLRQQLEQMRAEKAAYDSREQQLQQQVTDERDRSRQLLDELERERQKRDLEDRDQGASLPSRSGIVAFVLNLGVARGEAEGRRLVIPPDAEQVRLRVNFKVGDYKSYRATLETVDGREVWSRAGLQAREQGQGKTVILNIPASVLRDDDYILTLKGVTPTGEPAGVGEYSFRVVR